MSDPNHIEFSIDDEVTHSIIAGILGVVKEYQFSSRGGKVMTLYKVRWTVGKNSGTYTTSEYGHNLVATNKLYQYDPKQAGDTDEDV